MGSYAIEKNRLKEGGLAEVKNLMKVVLTTFQVKDLTMKTMQLIM
jgi:hypothetical protein